MNSTTSERYGGLNKSAKLVFVTVRAGDVPGILSGRAAVAPVEASSNVRKTLRASSIRPWRASQSGLSGTNNRNTQITMLAAAPIRTTQRQPSTPQGDSGTSHQARNATTGTGMNITA